MKKPKPTGISFDRNQQGAMLVAAEFIDTIGTDRELLSWDTDILPVLERFIKIYRLGDPAPDFYHIAGDRDKFLATQTIGKQTARTTNDQPLRRVLREGNATDWAGVSHLTSL